MKANFIFIDETLRNKKTLLCFLLLFLGVLLSSYNQEYSYNNFFVNIYNICGSSYFLLAISFSFLINSLNVMDELFTKHIIQLRISKERKHAFYKKEFILSNLFIWLLAIILVIAFSILFSGNNYEISDLRYDYLVYVIDIFLLINFLIFGLVSGMVLFWITKMWSKKIAIILYFSICSIVLIFTILSSFSIIKYLCIWLLLISIYHVLNFISKGYAL